MRIFADSHGREWTVFEVKKQGGPKDRWSYLPEEFGEGWLCFESKYAKRRLTVVPKGWREANEEELERMLRQAIQAGRGKGREDELRK